MKTITQILNKENISKKINRLSWQIIEHNIKFKELFIVGIQGNGFLIAKRISKILKNNSNFKIYLSEFNIDKKKPDLTKNFIKPHHKINYSKIPIIIIDDVINSGKTLVYSLNFFIKLNVFNIKIVTLIDRKHRLFPIKSDFSGLNLSTSIKNHVEVILGTNEGVYIK
jgi:pyrimidine operon attenuation protein/uracil phosphoribosyltransferase